jgi:hypothetical protein
MPVEFEGPTFRVSYVRFYLRRTARFLSFFFMGLVSAFANAQSVVEIDLPAYNVGFNTQTGMLYATVSSVAGEPYGNDLIEIAPNTGVITRHVFVGSEPDPLAISLDSAIAYAGLDGAGTVQEVDLNTFGLGTTFSVGISSSEGTLFANQISVMPGSPQTVAVSMRSPNNLDGFDGVTIFDEGVPRSLTLNSFLGPETIAFGSTGSVLYGYDNQDSEFDFYRMSVDENGVAIQSMASTIFYGFDVNIISDGDTVFTTSGVAVSGDTFGLLGTYEIGDFHAPVSLDHITNSVQFASGNSVVIFDRSTFVPTFAVTLAQVKGNPISAANCGGACMAVAYDSGQILILHNLQVDEIFQDGFDGD